VRELLFVSTIFLSLSAYSSDQWWVYSGKISTCKIAKFSPWKVLEIGDYQLDRYYKEKGLAFLEQKDNPRNMLIYSRSKDSCDAVAQIVKQGAG